MQQQYLLRAFERMERERSRRAARLERERQRIYGRDARIEEIDRDIAQTGRSVVGAVLSRRSDTPALIEGLRVRTQTLLNERRERLTEIGENSDALDDTPACAQCGDTGYRDGQLCDCVVRTAKQLCYDDISAQSALPLCRFDTFSLSYYHDTGDRARMEDILHYCTSYADDFDCRSPNLLFYGRTGLGKTHLSLSIANVAIDKGFGVVYTSAATVLTCIEDEHFGRAHADTSTLSSLLDCDLLILDDLGAEFSTSFTVATINNIINTRLLRRLPTIISTNLSIEELFKQYSERLASRLIGGYELFYFSGSDIRKIQKDEQND